MTRQDHEVRLLDDLSPEAAERPFLPGMGKDWLLPLYDPFTQLAGVRRRHLRLIELAGITPDQRVIDVGCGTGNLLQALAREVPGIDLTGLDPDPRALRRAAAKGVRSGARLTLIRGYADRLPVEDGSMDHVLSTMALHHLDPPGREGFAAEAFRVLRPGGRISILDFGGQVDHGTHGHGPIAHLSAMIKSRAAAEPHIRANLDDALPALLRQAGFADAAEIEHVDSLMGPLNYVQATRS